MIKIVMRKLFSYLNNPRIVMITILSLGLLVFIVGYFFSSNKEYVNNKSSESIEIESKSLVDKVSEIIYLPENEVPTIATVTDLAALKGQAFFVDAKVGDKVLIFSKAKKAILYNPKSNKIVTVAPLAIDSNNNPLQY